MSSKMAHKELKKEVNVLEQVRNNDRSFETWKQLKEGKKLKLKAKEKLNEIK
jgi:predicted PP-loop superfamily ATPase|tara:strand:- start:539 stop:694 length:156 start_codon:yes stop_codon:yes gene_type:complete